MKLITTIVPTFTIGQLIKKVWDLLNRNDSVILQSQRNIKIRLNSVPTFTIFKTRAAHGFIPDCVTLQFHMARLPHVRSLPFFTSQTATI